MTTTTSAPPLAERKRLRDILGGAEAQPGTDDILACVLPLLRQVQAVHEAGRVAPLVGVDDILVSHGRLWFENVKAREPRTELGRIRQLQREESPAFAVVGHARSEQDVSARAHSRDDLDIGERGSEISRPVYLSGYVSWEHEVDHHDALSDVFVLGLILGSVATDLDLADEQNLREFVAARGDLRKLNSRLHPVVARAIVRMTELDRHVRAQDLTRVIAALEQYREQGAGGPLDLSNLAGLDHGRDPAGRRAVICEHLRNRLFDVSRRNRLLHFKPSGQALNLTEVSVPLLLNYEHLAPGELLTWQGKTARAFSADEPVQLGKWLRFEDYPFVSGVLDTIRTRSARDQTEYGFSSLRLVLCFLHWHNLKDGAEERIHSPLLLLPATLTKKKGVRDAYLLTPSTDVAEVNPVLRHVFRQLYGIEIPQSVDLTEPESVRALYELLVRRVEESEPGVSIDYVDKPRIDLIQSRVKRRLDSFRKRSHLTGLGVRKFGDVEYSYREHNFQPLGLRLFVTRVSPSPAPMRDFVAAPRPKVFQMARDPGVRELERTQYTLHDHSEATPYRWAFDLCSVTLGNFNYQKITLVRDYTALLEDGGRANGAFDALFSAEARPVEVAHAPLTLDQQFTVVPADPSQLQAVARARGGSSYIIQGPPGTGKSQTITNLIADYVARGKRVLFVCEKRAAIDVVYYRLKQRQLDRLACLIHDSQDDKKAFIQDLKSSYEAWTDSQPSATDLARTRCLSELARQYEQLDRLSAGMTAPAAGSAATVGQLIRRAIELESVAPQLTAAQKEQLPTHAEFAAHRELLVRTAEALEAVGAEPVLAKHPARLLSQRVLAAARPVDAITRKLAEANAGLAKLSVQLPATALRDIYSRVDFALRVKPLIQSGLLALLDAASGAYRTFQVELKRLANKRSAFDTAKQNAAAWRERLPAADLARALELARRFSGTLLRFLYPTFWRLRGILRSRYDFSVGIVAPTYVQALEQLEAEYATAAEAAAVEKEIAEGLGIEELAPVCAVVEVLHADAPVAATERQLREELRGAAGEGIARSLLSAAGDVGALRQTLDELLQDYENLSAAELASELRALEQAGENIPELVTVLRELQAAPPQLRAALRNLPMTVDALEAAVCGRAIEESLRGSRELAKFDAELLANARRSLAEQHGAWREANATQILEVCRQRFSEHIRISQAAAAGLTAEEKKLKKDYAAGRRELEHEFGKVMRFKSIRDLMSNRTGAVVRDLKPIWLMSPLSVADTLPCSSDFFDVVIFDEASQIPLEDAVPAIYRAEQCIVVGDQMQLPPTQFFAAARASEDDRVSFEENDEAMAYELDADSLLSHCARSLPSTLLAWHYRSRDEALISFCNQAFYAGRLLTIPTPQRQQASGEIRVREAEDGRRGAQEALARAVSFHRLDDAPYENRRNLKEARYIAELVRELLSRGTGMSMGIVAFSEAQQDEIERAVNDLAADDAEFRRALDVEFEREEDDQFCGLFVKNLENVQGDERDMIILSVCYGPDAKGRMLMNFGPINKNGGEKRLNVIFSRAKQRIAVVSSIDYTQITNEYNDGANTLRAYLQYAAAASRGDTAEVQSVLASMAPLDAAVAQRATVDAVKTALTRALRDRGYEVELDLGSSRFRCDLAVRPKHDGIPPLALVVDSEDFYASATSDERFRLRPAILTSFGWKVEMVLGKDWLADPEAVLRRLEHALTLD